jgi:hypothetical protein
MGRIAQIYGFTLCLVAVIAILLAIVNLVNAAFTYIDPLKVNQNRALGGYPLLSSYEAFKSTYAAAARNATGQEKVAMPNERDLRAEFDARRADAISAGRFDALRDIVGDAVVIVVAAFLFRFHWRWLQQRSIASNW